MQCLKAKILPGVHGIEKKNEKKARYAISFWTAKSLVVAKDLLTTLKT